MFTPETMEVIMVSFEGPDAYSQAGGLGVRAREKCKALAADGFETHLYFVGDPTMPHREDFCGVHLIRCLQELSRRFPLGVYEGESEKVEAITNTLPQLLISDAVAGALARDRTPVVIFEEWQTARACITLHIELERMGLRDQVVLLWNANNRFGFDDIDWRSLEHACGLTTVSRYMKQMMRPYGARPVVVPNGIPESALRPVDQRAVDDLRQAAGTGCLAFKLGRFSADKGWHQAVSAIAELRKEGMPARLLMRGGMEGYGRQVLDRARAIGLDVCDWLEPVNTISGVCAALAQSDGVAIINVANFFPDTIVPEIEVASTAVLANSGHEPFGLVGLEAMAAGAVAIVGATGEEYARSYANAIVIETDEASEVASAIRGLAERPDLSQRLRDAARHDAAEYTWPKVIDGWLERLRFLSAQQHVSIRIAS